MMDWTRFSNPARPDEADLSWLLRPMNETGMGIGQEREGVFLRSPSFGRVRHYMDDYGSHRFVGYAHGVPVAAIQVVTALGRPGVVANVYTVPELRGRGLASELLVLARKKLGEIQHSKHLTKRGRRFAARKPNQLNDVEDDVQRIIEEQDRRAAEKAAFGTLLWKTFEREGVVAIPTRDPAWTHVTLTHSTYPNVQYQVTRWDEEGPVGHVDITRGKLSAIDEMWYYVGGLDWRERWNRRLSV